MVPLVLDELLEEVRKLYKEPALEWVTAKATPAELTTMSQEAAQDSPFDPYKLKQSMWSAYTAGKAQLVCKECPLAKVIAVLPKGRTTIPLEAWSRVFQWFGAPSQGKWLVFWYGAETPRKFPKAGAPLAAEHLNGGYTNPCSTNGIFIYRIEEATRVLIHELMHAACLDPPSPSVPFREATVETWAELFLVALKSKGDLSAAEKLWSLQAQWVADTNERAATAHGIRGNTNYGWRYLNGRAGIYAQLGIGLPVAGPKKPARSRFTHPALGD